ncbi:MAG: hypothetical protein R3D25_00435 [Geminicoccaceae bacterium]
MREAASTSTPRISERSTTSPPSQSPPGNIVVATATHGDEQVMLPCEGHRRDDIGGTERADDEAGMPVDRRVPDPAGRIVVGIRGPDHPTGEAGCESVDGVCCNGDATAVHEPGGRHGVFPVLALGSFFSRWAHSIGMPRLAGARFASAACSAMGRALRTMHPASHQPDFCWERFYLA